MSPQAVSYPVTRRSAYAAAFASLGVAAGGGPFLLLFAGNPNKLLLQNGTSRLLITGSAPAGPFVSAFYLWGF